jgi:formylglycine-generating enzyme required for sulfatase activity
VTVAQYQAFVSAGGYGMERYWAEAEATGVWKDGRVKGPFDEDPRDRPVDYGEPFNLQNHPVVGITWYEAVAYCRWLTEKLKESRSLSGDLAVALRKGWIVRLPGDAGWEKAARGTDGRMYPWGNDEPDPDRANYSETGIGATSAVGCFQKGASPYGAQDMSGNVWEWTQSLWGRGWEPPEFEYPYDPSDGRENLSARQDNWRVLRGGSFINSRWDTRCFHRFRLYPGYRDKNLGFRVVLAPRIPSVL